MNFEAWLIVILDGFNGWKLSLVDLIYKFPEILFFICNFLYFEVKEYSFCGLNCSSEGFPVIETSCHPIDFEVTTAFVILPTLGVFCYFDCL